MAAPSKKIVELFVSRIPWTVSSTELKQYFGQFGPVAKCQLPFNKETGFHKGFCWIGFRSEEGVKNALEKDSHQLEGATMLVQRNRKIFSAYDFNKEKSLD
ncbi:SRA stem-loop-interacting RNA-binding protein, mitochondrial [Brachionichthys hirsutus]|uniref:SRA stem-loop-interacting RNA-binding protein, mitochondrial n=1 Tax=Brachionichthys hirsutus TaxID=412623 RepID=UPI00360465EF